MGANLGDRRAALRTAVAALPDVVAVSPVYETGPVGGPPGQSPYLNLVVELETDLTPRDLLELAHRLEEAAGRVRAEPDGPRTLDVDVLLVGDLTVREPDLVIPHPRMWQRRFVLAPLADLAGGHVRRLGPLFDPPEAAGAGGDVRRLGPLFDPPEAAGAAGHVRRLGPL